MVVRGELEMENSPVLMVVTFSHHCQLISNHESFNEIIFGARENLSDSIDSGFHRSKLPIDPGCSGRNVHSCLCYV